MNSKITEQHRNRPAYIYVRQSTNAQVLHHQESTERQYALRTMALELGWNESAIRTLDRDLGLTGSEMTRREDFKTLVADVSMGQVGAVFALEVSRLVRSNLDWHRLLELCALTATLVIDEDGCYDPSDFNDGLLLGLKGAMAQAELHFLHARLQGGKLNKAKKGELRFPLPVGYCYDEQGRIVPDADAEVRGAVEMVFRLFRETGSAYRTEQDATLALRRQVPLQRFTPLDRLIVARAQPLNEISGDFRVTAHPTRPGLGRFAAVREQWLASRLMTLQTMGLARKDGQHQWQVRRDLETALRAMKRAADNQKTLAAHGALLSDPRLQLSAPNWRDINSLEGRVLSHGEEEDGRRYLMLEGADGRVYYLRCTQELDEARSRGDLTTNSFVVINKTVDEDRRRRIVVTNLGNAEALFENRVHFRSQAKRLVEHGVNLSDDQRWGGWLGRYYEKLREAVYDLGDSKARSRNRSLSLER